MKIFAKMFGGKEILPTFAIPNENNTFETAEIAQLVEHNLAKVRVASSSLVFRSKTGHLRMTFIMEITRRGTIIFRSSITMVGFFCFYLCHS